MSVEIERKWLLAENPVHHFSGEIIHIDQIYNPDNSVVERVRRSEHDLTGEVEYTRCKKIRTGEMSCIEEEHEISQAEYVFTKERYKQGGSHLVSKDRFVFINQHGHEPVYAFEVDLFKAPKRIKGMIVLEVELDSEREQPTIPPELIVVKEITGDKNFSNRRISTSPSKVSAAFIKETLSVLSLAIRFINK